MWAFCTHVFSHAANDPENGDYANLLNPFLIDVNNGGNNAAPATLQNQIAAKGANLDPLALVILHKGVTKLYLCPQHLDQLLGPPVNPCYDTVYAFDGDLLDNDAYHAIVPNSCYNLIPNSILVPTIPTNTAALGADPNLTQLGSYNPGDTNRETTRVRGIVPIPFAYAPLFLANNVNPCYYFETIYPQIVTNQRQQAWDKLLRFFPRTVENA